MNRSSHKCAWPHDDYVILSLKQLCVSRRFQPILKCLLYATRIPDNSSSKFNSLSIDVTFTFKELVLCSVAILHSILRVYNQVFQFEGFNVCIGMGYCEIVNRIKKNDVFLIGFQYVCIEICQDPYTAILENVFFLELELFQKIL